MYSRCIPNMEFIFKRNMKVMSSKVKDLDMIEGKVPLVEVALL